MNGIHHQMSGSDDSRVVGDQTLTKSSIASHHLNHSHIFIRPVQSVSSPVVGKGGHLLHATLSQSVGRAVRSGGVQGHSLKWKPITCSAWWGVNKIFTSMCVLYLSFYHSVLAITSTPGGGGLLCKHPLPNQCAKCLTAWCRMST